MRRLWSWKHVLVVAVPLVLILATALPGIAASTTKALSTNFTLVNLGVDTGNPAATGAIQYLKSDGSQWKADESFSIPTIGGQLVYRQYADGALSTGQGSAIVSSDQPLGAVVQIQARGQTATSGAYIGMSQGSDTIYVPLAARHLTTASGMGNSQIIVQNTGTSTINPTVDLIKSDGSATVSGKQIGNVAAGASFVYDLETEAALGNGWLGSVVVHAGSGNQVAVVTNFFTGPNAMLTFEGFPKETLSKAWVVPLFFSRLANGLSAPVTIQNVSGGTIAAGAASMTCTVDPTSGTQTPASFTVSNSTAIGNNQSYSWNPVTDKTNFPMSGWIGACRISTPANVVSFVQLRFVGAGLEKADAYQALSANSTDKTVVVPLVAKRLGNGFASAVTIANLSNSAAAHVHLSYQPAAESTSQATLELDKVIAAGSSLIQNQRVDSSNSQGVNLPDGWQGTLTVISSDQAINGVVQLDFLGMGGDPYMTHNIFTKP